MVITLFLILKTGTQNWTPYKNTKPSIFALYGTFYLFFKNDKVKNLDGAKNACYRCFLFVATNSSNEHPP